jgi:L-threonylcarbamoyladenylate synthase
LSYTELVKRQKIQEDRKAQLNRERDQFEAQVKTSFVSPDIVKDRSISSFRPQLSSPRYFRALEATNIDNSTYPFPEDALPSIPRLRRKKPVLFKTGHRFLLTRYDDARYKAILKKEKQTKQLAVRITRALMRRKIIEDQQMETDAKVLLDWKEGDQTYVLPVTTEDIGRVHANGVEIQSSSHTRNSLQLAAKLLNENQVVAFPTETVYGLGANALSTEAVEKIYKAKNRPSDNPLITHFGSMEHLRSFTTIPEVYVPLIEKFWPGPLTILLPVTPEMGISPIVTAGLDTVAVRIPSSPLARALLLEARLPIAAPSANASTRPSPTLAVHVYNDLNKRIPLILSADEDVGSQCDVGLESTVVDGLSTPPTILRLGGVSLEQIRELGKFWNDITIYKKPPIQANGVTPEEFKPRTPGMKYRHYSPRCPVYVYRFNSPQPTEPSRHLLPSESVERKVAVLCTKNWEPMADSGAEVQFNWLGSDGEEVARNLFKCIRDMDEWGAEAIFVEGIEEIGIGRSVMERLRKMGVDHDKETIKEIP